MAAAAVVVRRTRALVDRLRRLALREEGFGLIELVIAMTILTIAISALLTVFVNSGLSLQRAGRKGTSLALADSQMELYRRLGFAGVRIDGSLVPPSGTYVTANSTDSTLPPSTSQAVGGSNGDDACPGDPAAACLPVQTVTGPDHRQYRIDTYVHYVDDDGSTLSSQPPASGFTLKRVTVVVRDATSETILARESSAFEGP